MDNRIKVFNRRKHAIHLVIPHGDRKVTHIVKGQNKGIDGIVFLTQDELTYIQMTTTFFTEGKLYLEEEAQKNMEESLDINTKDNPGFMSDEEIAKFLQSKSAPKLKEWIDEIEDPALLAQIFEIQKELDLNRKKLVVLEEKMPDLFENERIMEESLKEVEDKAKR